MEAVLALLALEQRSSATSRSYNNGTAQSHIMHTVVHLSTLLILLSKFNGFFSDGFFLIFVYIDPFSPFNESFGTRVNVDLRRNVQLKHNEQSRL